MHVYTRCAALQLCVRVALPLRCLPGRAAMPNAWVLLEAAEE